MAKLEIHRGFAFNSMLRSFDILIDGEDIGDIRMNTTKSFDLSTGEYQLKASIDWCGSKEHHLVLTEGETVKLKITPVPGFGIMMLLLLIGSLSGFGKQLVSAPVEFFSTASSVVWFIPTVLLMGYLVYFITIGRNNFLKWEVFLK
ncbi:MAG: hypothetical protein AAGC85_12065 [Bacteroidota bacterium]